MVVHTAYKIIVRGLVQGVYFRETARKEAYRLGIKGYVKNTDEECVEIVAVGPSDDIDEFVKWCHNGTEESRVDSVEVEIIDIKTDFKDFIILR